MNELRTDCARAAMQWLRGSLDLGRPIRSLTKRELEGVAEAVTTRFIASVSAHIEAKDLDGEYRRLLFAAPPELPADLAEYADLFC